MRTGWSRRTAGRERWHQAQAGLTAMQTETDALIVLLNEKMHDQIRVTVLATGVTHQRFQIPGVI